MLGPEHELTDVERTFLYGLKDQIVQRAGFILDVVIDWTTGPGDDLRPVLIRSLELSGMLADLAGDDFIADMVNGDGGPGMIELLRELGPDDLADKLRFAEHAARATTILIKTL